MQLKRFLKSLNWLKNDSSLCRCVIMNFLRVIFLFMRHPLTLLRFRIMTDLGLKAFASLWCILLNSLNSLPLDYAGLHSHWMLDWKRWRSKFGGLQSCFTLPQRDKNIKKFILNQNQKDLIYLQGAIKS